MTDAMRVTSASCSKFLVSILKLILEMDTSTAQTNPMIDWNASLVQLQQHNENEIQQLATRLHHKWTGGLTISQEVPLSEGKEDEIVEDDKSDMCDPFLGFVSLPCEEIKTDNAKHSHTFPSDVVRKMTAMPSGEESVRVEGLHAPLPRAFQIKTAAHSIPHRAPQKRQKKTHKSVQWAPPEQLVTIQIFNEEDPPAWLFNPPETTTLIKAAVQWTHPASVKLKAEWKVKYGEESIEKMVQKEREERVVAFNSETAIGDQDLEEPYYEDMRPQADHNSQILKLEQPGKEAKTSFQSQVCVDSND